MVTFGWLANVNDICCHLLESIFVNKNNNIANRKEISAEPFSKSTLKIVNKEVAISFHRIALVPMLGPGSAVAISQNCIYTGCN